MSSLVKSLFGSHAPELIPSYEIQRARSANNRELLLKALIALTAVVTGIVLLAIMSNPFTMAFGAALIGIGLFATYHYFQVHQDCKRVLDPFCKLLLEQQ